jgi:hypothetical protein
LKTLLGFAFLIIAGVTGLQAEVKLPLARGFDFPVGKPEASGYYKARGFWPNGHLGEDWNGKGGGNTDLGDSVYACADGIVVQSKDIRVGWGNVVIIRHIYRETDGSVKVIDSLYGHLNERLVTLNQRVSRGQRIGTIGTNRGMYLAHLHFEIRKNLAIGMNRSSFDRTSNSYHDPTKFIRAHRKCASSTKLYPVPMDTFAPYGKKLTASNVAAAKVNTAGSGLKIPVDNSRREEIQRMVTKAKSSNWAPPSPTSERTVTRSKPAPEKRVTLNPDIREIVKSTSSNQSTPEKKVGFWTKFKLKFTSKKEGDVEAASKPRVRRRRLFGR